ncbi:MAG: hypothetical protein U0Q07_15850 [Acidimicrobiales bacterium]
MAAAALIALVVVAGPPTASPAGTSAPSTTVTTPGSGTGRALLTDVGLAAGSSVVGRATFTFADPVVPAVRVQRIAGPAILSPSGTPVAVNGDALLSVVLADATAFDTGTCIAPAGPAPGPGEAAIGVGFTCASPAPAPWPVVRVARVVPTPLDDTARLTAAVSLVLAGPTAGEQAAGFSSPFSAATAGTLTSVAILAGTATVDLAPALTAALPAPDGDAVARGLDGTLAQVPGLVGARYTIGGSCAAFTAWSGLASCDRTQQQLVTASIVPTYRGPARVEPPAGGAGPITEAVATEDFEAQLGWVLGVDVPAGQDVVATAVVSGADRTVVVTVSLVPAPTTTTTTPPAPVTASFTG